MPISEQHGQRRGGNLARLRARNSTIVIALVAVLAGMGGLTYSAVPLYRLFCQVTGFGGTTRVADSAPAIVADRIVTVRFNADIAGGLGWRFRPPEREVRVRVGEIALAAYRVENVSGETSVGAATFNVTPHKMGRYFSKVQCFCFDEQTLAPNESVEMPVTFFVDPKMLDDPSVADVNTVTLSYTFFEVRSAADRNSPARSTAQKEFSGLSREGT